ncbi:MAG TPA: peptidylprolyl isomerase [Vicinamibacteria bacterium]|nr:peptidylprolyl isomerase [Vicinamibacteria bacterium]
MKRLLSLLLLALACRESPSDPVILSLKGQVVRRSDFERYLAAMEARNGPLPAEVRQALLETYIERRVLVLEARLRGLLPPDAKDEDEAGAVQRLVDQQLASQVQVGEDEIGRLHAENPAECTSPETVTLRQIVVATPNMARDVRRRVRRDPKNFDVLARTTSRAPEAAAGGAMGTFARGQLPEELERPAFALEPGQTSEVIETPLGYHVLRIEARQVARQVSFEECKERLRATLIRQKSDQVVRQFVAGLLARAKVNHEAAKARPSRP